jgi:3-hydroxyacyl-CoA dehydrogenase
VGNLIVRKVGVLGAGVMGAQIAAHLVNVRVPVLLFDLPAREGPKSGIARTAIDKLAKLSPAPLAAPGLAAHIEALNYEEHLDRLAECDLVIEAIAERMDWKLDLYRRIGPHLRPDSLIASNTSGLSIETIGNALPEAMRPRFCGIHFFNPPRYMTLVELIPTPATDRGLLDALETFLTTTVGKGVVRAKDTPNFIANRYGIFSMIATMVAAERFDLPFDAVDDLTGTRLARAKSATFRTADVVGLDTMAHVIRTMADTLPEDPWHRYFRSPDWLSALIERGALGQKTRAGIFSKPGKEILVLDRASSQYVPSSGKASDEVAAILKIRSPAERFAALRASQDPQARFLWAIQRDLFHYCAYHLASVADNARDVDLALRWGFGWSAGPFETWQAAGWAQIATWIAEDIAAGESMVDAPLPAWVLEPGRTGVHAEAGSWSAERAALVPRSDLGVYRRQAFPPVVLGERAAPTGQTLFENTGVRLWTGIEATGDDIAVLSFRTKMNIIDPAVLEGIARSIEIAESRFRGMVLWQTGEPFSLGADLSGVSALIAQGRFDDIDAMIERFQQTSLSLRDAQVPVVAAVRGMALGGGCEFAMHAARVVASLESYLGLVETGVGLIPGGGGCKELALRAARAHAATEVAGASGWLFDALRPAFQTVAMASVSKSAEDARAIGLLRPTDVVIAHPHELLQVACGVARGLADTGWRAPLPAGRFPVMGENGIATFEAQLVNLRDGGFISAHDHTVGLALAEALCGGRIAEGSLVDERWMLDVERRLFVDLLRHPLTQARIAHTLATGKPLRN